MINTYICNISDFEKIADSTYEYFYSIIGKEKEERLLNYRRMEDRVLSLFGDVITRVHIAKLLKVRPSEIRFATTSLGKPWLLWPLTSNLFFNISHSGSYVAVSIGNVPLGVDIERIDVNLNLSIANIGFTNEENKAELTTWEFYKLWTLKESFIKTIGQGFSVSPKSFWIKYNDNKIEVIADWLACAYQYKFWNYDFNNEYVFSICYNGYSRYKSDERNFVKFINLKEIVQSARLLQKEEHI